MNKNGSRVAAATVMLDVFRGNPGMQKFDILFDVAWDALPGHIVEVGTGDGFGAVSLALGARGNPVYTIDPHEECRGWANEPYGPTDRTACLQNVLAAGVAERVRIINLYAQAVVACWPEVVSLLWWDLGQHYGPHITTVLEWCAKVVPGGTVLLNETFADDLGADAVVDTLVVVKDFELLRVEYGIRVLRRAG